MRFGPLFIREYQKPLSMLPEEGLFSYFDRKDSFYKR